MAFLRNSQITAYQDLILQRIFSDTCQFIPTDGASTVDEWGNPVRTAQAPRTYRGSSDIPCVMYQSRAFENDELLNQATVANRYYVEVPKDFTFDETDTIVTSDGRYLEIRKVSGLGQMELTIEIQTGEIMTDYDINFGD